MSAPQRPGLPSIAYRIGTFSSFRSKMLAQISEAKIRDLRYEDSPELADFLGLSSLSTRRDDDFSITLLDLWATVADTLSFYQERLINESFLRTAGQADSVISLATLAAQAAEAPRRTASPAAATAPPPAPPAAALTNPAALRLGTAAIANLLMTVDTGAVVNISPGLRVQSVPGPNEKPQTFEVIQPAVADARFNRLRLYPMPSPPGPPSALKVDSTGGLLDRRAGPDLSARLQPRDDVVLFGQHSAAEEKKVDKLTIADDRVLLAWKTAVKEGGHELAFKFKKKVGLFGSAAPASYMKPAGPAPAGRISWQLVQLLATDYVYPSPGCPEEHSAIPPGGASECVCLCLDAKYPDLDPGMRLLAADTSPGGAAWLLEIAHVDQTVATFGPFPTTVTRVWLTVDPLQSNYAPAPSALQFGDRRTVAIYVLEGEQIAFCPYVYDFGDGKTALGQTATLPGLVLDGAIRTAMTIGKGQFVGGAVLSPKDIDIGRVLVVTDAAGNMQQVRVTDVPQLVPDQNDPLFGHMEFVFDGAIAAPPTTAVAMGNLAVASHGETVANEVLGSGDASLTFQQFTLKKTPLTILPSVRSGGRLSTLHVFIDGLEWFEVPSLATQDGNAQVFVTEAQADGSTIVRFGDGKRGRTPTTGRSNVTATYRVGSGLAGNVRAGTLTTLLDRPTGLLAAANPFPANGGTDAPSVVGLKAAAGSSVRTAGRIVTLADLEDAALAAGNVGKAAAALLKVPRGQGVIHLTVAGQQGKELTDDELARLSAAVAAAYDGLRRLVIQRYAPVAIQIQASVTVASSQPVADIVPAGLDALKAAFGFDAMSLGKTIYPADVHTALEAVPGISGVNVTRFIYKKDEDAEPHGAVMVAPKKQAPVQPRLVMFGARVDNSGSFQPADLAFVEVPGQDLSILVKGGIAQ
ncbi:MAG TPA: hypothetical protein VGX27_14145 [Candidatus Dormibacteraeota bacterium]|nr:hypothetical protein [Candidatus Dormibacteraeota bacterium]